MVLVVVVVGCTAKFHHDCHGHALSFLAVRDVHNLH